MSPRIVFALTMLGLLLLANLLMINGFTNYPIRAEGFVDYMLDNAAPTGDNYQAIGTYDNVVKKPANGLSNWRGPAPNEPLLGPDVKLGPDNLFMFKNNQCKPECCPSSYTCSSGCVCTTAQQRDFIASRGGNRNVPTDL